MQALPSEINDRRQVIKWLAAFAGATVTIPMHALAFANSDRSVGRKWKLGMIADLHGGLAPDASRRLDTFLSAMRGAECDALVQLGDFAYPNEKHQEYADKFNAAHPVPIHVIGNHEFDYGLDRQDCFRAWGINAAYYRKELDGLRILVLDGNEQGSPNHRGGYPAYVGAEQLRWLEQELSDAPVPVLILSHQPLAGRSAVDNAAEIAKLLGRFQAKILMCVNGHTHLDALVDVEGVPCLHINSASYFWVGGEARMAAYTEPLFTTMTIDSATATIEVAPAVSAWADKSPEELGYFTRENPPPREMVTPQIRAQRLSRSVGF